MSIKAGFPILSALVFCASLSAAFSAHAATDAAAEKRTGVVTMRGKPLTLLGHEIKVGEKAPDFTVIDRNMQPVGLSDYAGKVRIITIYPSIDTKVCSQQVRHFNVEAAKLNDVQILAVSVDLPVTLDRFCAAEGIDKVLTLSDHRKTDFGLKYGFLIDELRLLARGTVIVDQDGIVRYVEYVKDLGSEPDYNRAIDVAKKLAHQA